MILLEVGRAPETVKRLFKSLQAHQREGQMMSAF